MESPLGGTLSTKRGTTVVTFEGDQRKPMQMPYLLLDPEWYRKTSEDERLQQGKKQGIWRIT